MRKASLPYAAFAGCSLVWGSTFLAIRFGNDTIAPLWGCSLRLGLAAILLNLLLLATRQPWPKGKALQSAVAYGFFEFGLGFTFLYYGEHAVPSGLAAVVYAICPIAVMLCASVLGMEKLNATKLSAAILALGGVALIFWKELRSGLLPTPLFAVFVAAITAAIAGLMLQRGPKQNAIGANAVGALVGLPCAILGSLLLGEREVLPRTLAEIFPVCYLAVMGSVLAFGLFAWLLGQWRATTVAFIGVIVPVIAVILGAVVRHEAFSMETLAGGAVVLMGVTIALRAEKQLTSEPLP
jgi:drug/metabolite transporter (DMT)-like permease